MQWVPMLISSCVRLSAISTGLDDAWASLGNVAAVLRQTLGVHPNIAGIGTLLRIGLFCSLIGLCPGESNPIQPDEETNTSFSGLKSDRIAIWQLSRTRFLTTAFILVLAAS